MSLPPLWQYQGHVEPVSTEAESPPVDKWDPRSQPTPRAPLALTAALIATTTFAMGLPEVCQSPSTDIANVGFQRVVDTGPPDAKYIDEDYPTIDGEFLDDDPTSVGDHVECRLEFIPAPEGPGSHVIKATANRVAPNGSWDCNIQLRQGTTVIATTQTVTVATGAVTDIIYELSAAEVAAITDYGDLRLRFRVVAENTAGTGFVRLHMMQMCRPVPPVEEVTLDKWFLQEPSFARSEEIHPSSIPSVFFQGEIEDVTLDKWLVQHPGPIPIEPLPLEGGAFTEDFVVEFNELGWDVQDPGPVPLEIPSYEGGTVFEEGGAEVVNLDKWFVQYPEPLPEPVLPIEGGALTEDFVAPAFNELGWDVQDPGPVPPLVPDFSGLSVFEEGGAEVVNLDKWFVQHPGPIPIEPTVPEGFTVHREDFEELQDLDWLIQHPDPTFLPARPELVGGAVFEEGGAEVVNLDKWFFQEPLAPPILPVEPGFFALVEPLMAVFDWWVQHPEPVIDPTAPEGGETFTEDFAAALEQIDWLVQHPAAPPALRPVDEGATVFEEGGAENVEVDKWFVQSIDPTFLPARPDLAPTLSLVDFGVPVVVQERIAYVLSSVDGTRRFVIAAAGANETENASFPLAWAPWVLPPGEDLQFGGDRTGDVVRITVIYKIE